MYMYFNKYKQKRKEKNKKKFGILKATKERSRIRIRNPVMRIPGSKFVTKFKMSLIRNTAGTIFFGSLWPLLNVYISFNKRIHPPPMIKQTMNTWTVLRRKLNFSQAERKF